MNTIKNCFFTVLSALIIFSCTKNNIEQEETDISDNLAEIEKEISNIDFTQTIQLEIINKDFFYGDLQNIIETNSRESSYALACAVQNKTTVNENNRVIVPNWTAADSVILESLLKSLDKVSFEHKALICDHYFNELSVGKQSEIELSLQQISYLRDYFIYFFIENNVLTKGFDSCFDKCMYKKAHSVFVIGNWVDKVEFLYSMPGNVAWWTASCTWDCV